MYLHIGKEYCLDENKIIGIFDINNINKEIYSNIKNNLIDISDGVQKTLILVEDEKIKGYITNISSATLRKRNIYTM